MREINEDFLRTAFEETSRFDQFSEDRKAQQPAQESVKQESKNVCIHCLGTEIELGVYKNLKCSWCCMPRFVTTPKLRGEVMDAYEQGKKAALEGVKFYNNPYKCNSRDIELFRLWFGGWCEGSQVLQTQENEIEQLRSKIKELESQLVDAKKDQARYCYVIDWLESDEMGTAAFSRARTKSEYAQAIDAAIASIQENQQ